MEVSVDPDLFELAEEFLETRRAELPTLKALFARANYKEISRLAHNMKGNGSAYGFVRFTEIGKALQAASESQNKEECEQLLTALATFIAEVRVVSRKKNPA